MKFRVEPWQLDWFRQRNEPPRHFHLQMRGQRTNLKVDPGTAGFLSEFGVQTRYGDFVCAIADCDDAVVTASDAYASFVSCCHPAD